MAARLTDEEKERRKGLRHWRRNEYVTQDEFDRRMEELRALGRRHREEYEAWLVAMYGRVPDWARKR